MPDTFYKSKHKYKVHTKNMLIIVSHKSHKYHDDPETNAKSNKTYQLYLSEYMSDTFRTSGIKRTPSEEDTYESMSFTPIARAM